VKQAYDFQPEHLHYLPVNRYVFNVKRRGAGTFSGHLGFCSEQVLLCHLGTWWNKKREVEEKPRITGTTFIIKIIRITCRAA